jgi:hypothetical protein
VERREKGSKDGVKQSSEIITAISIYSDSALLSAYQKN